MTGAPYTVAELWRPLEPGAAVRPTFEDARRLADAQSSFHRRPYSVWTEPDVPGRLQCLYVSLAGYWSEVRAYVEDLAAGRHDTSLFPTLHAWATEAILRSDRRPTAADSPAAVERFMRARYPETAARYVAPQNGRQILDAMRNPAAGCSLDWTPGAGGPRHYHQPLAQWLTGKDTGKDAVFHYYETPQVVALFALLTRTDQGSYGMVRTAGVEPACPEGRWNLKANQPPGAAKKQSVTAHSDPPETAATGKDTGKDDSEIEADFIDLQRAIRLYAPQRFKAVKTRPEILKAAAYLVREGFAPEAR